MIPFPNYSIKSALTCSLAVALAASSVQAGPYGSGTAGGGGLDSQASREIVRRQQAVVEAERLERIGDRAAADGDLETAYLNYLEALDVLGSGEAVDSTRSRVLGKFSSTAVSYSEELIAKGRYGEAEMAAKTVLLQQYNPTYQPAIALLSRLEQNSGSYYNKTVTPQFAADREEVSRLMVEAEGFYSRGSYDLAIKRYEQVLNIDRYNIAARKGIEKVDNAKANYAGEAYNETRSRMLWQVTKGWEMPVRRLETSRTTAGSAVQIQGTGAEQITAKLNRIIVPRLDLRDTTVREAVTFLQRLSVQLDSLEPDPARRGVNIFLKLPAGGGTGGEGLDDGSAAPTASADTRVTLNLSGVPLYEALRYLAQLAGLKIKVEDFAVAIVPLTDVSDELVTKEYLVPPTFIPATPAQAEATGFGQFTPSDQSRVGRRQTAQQYLASQGVEFPEGATAQYIPAGSRLVVRNTQDNVDLIDVLVDASLGAAPTQIEIESKFVEINQNNLRELGFDWLLGPFEVATGVYAGGGGASGNAAVFPFQEPGAASPVGSNLVTNGLRSGVGAGQGQAISANGLDSLLANLGSGVAPGIFSLSGIYTNPQFQLVIRALDQKKGIDLMSAPKVTTKSGLKAVVSIVREFIYPTDFDPPQIPTEQTSTTSAQTGDSLTGLTFSGTGFQFPNGIITPSTPTGFETRNTGVTLDVLPTVGPDGYTIDLEITPEVVDFDGFINYGSPILGIRPVSAGGLVTGIQTFPLTPNVINQPIFTVRKVNTKVTIWDGSTVALGGLIREDVQKVQDKVPVLGDVPLVGRLFRSDVDQKLKKNLIIFVTARIMDAAGKPVRSDMEEEEIVEPLGLPDDLPRPVIQVKSMGAGK